MSSPLDLSSTLKPIQACVHSPDYTPVEYAFPSDVDVEVLRRFTENSLPNTLGHNDAIENTGDAYLNMAVLEVLMNHLNSIREKNGYDDRKLNACAAYLHPKLISNDILGRIYHKLDEGWASGPLIRTVDREACWAWVAGNYQGDPPKVLADLFEAQAWLIFQISRFRGLRAYVEKVFIPLLPTAIASFEVAHQSVVSNRLPRNSSDSFDTFFDCIWQFRQNDARQVDSMHVASLNRHISRSPETLKAKLEDLAISLKNGPPVHFRVDNQGRITRIGGMHQCLQLRGRTVLRFFLAKAYNQAYPLSRSAGRKAAGFQSLLFGLTGSDECLHSLVDLLHMGDVVYGGGTATFTDPLSSRQAAELFFAAIVLLQSQNADCYRRIRRAP
ncbi:hypothetical protein EYR38_010719 [Pleurotus pulmonarius]|nr:hypothetical protein EYR38_010719 [Pleurotus pulmonarius]